MSEFNDTVRHILNEFKSTYRRDLPKSIRAHIDIKFLAIDRKHIQNTHDLALYHKANAVLDYLQDKTLNNSALQDHTGIESFIDTLQETLDAYLPYGDHIVHKNRYSSEVLIRAIQMICLHKIQLNYESLLKLKKCCKTLHDLGNTLHWEKLMYAIKSHYKSDPVFFDHLIKHCKDIQKS